MSEGQTKVKTMTGANSGGYSRFLSFHGRNPDVLNSIANLSNDEVFTPPEFANRMLDTLEKAWAESNAGENIWSNSNLKFLDPFTKSGVFLREIATRLIKGLESEIPDLQDRVDHILTKQVYGIATTRLTSLIARRSLYCSKKANGKHSVTKKFKNENGNIWFEPLTHTWNKGTVVELTMDESGKEVERYVDGKCKYCGASKRDFEREEGLELHAYGLIHTDDPDQWVREKFGVDMQFDVIIGNPPYQLSTGGTGGAGVQAAPIYNHFVTQAKALDPRYLVMVTPSRWFSGGMGLDGFRQEMLSDNRLRVICDYPDSNQIFKGTQIKGGVSYFLWDRDNPGKVSVSTAGVGGNISTMERELLEPGSDVFIRYNEGVSILNKVFLAESMDNQNQPGIPEKNKFMSLVSSIGAFGLDTTFKGKDSANQGDLRVFRNGGIGFVERVKITKSIEAIDQFKVFIPPAGSGSDTFPHAILGKPFAGLPGDISSWTYMHIGPFQNEKEVTNVISYIQTKFFRFLVLLHKPTQHATKSVYSFVPNQDFTKPWNDEQLYKKYGITTEEIAFIDELIRPMELNNG
jgi:site-specific DNA-methyltransferase (adenine-specific)